MDNIEGKLKAMMERMRELEGKLHARRRSTLGGQIHSIKKFTDDEPESHSAHEQHVNDEELLASQVINACLAEINLTKGTELGASWYLDLGASYHVTGDKSVFSSLQNSHGPQIRSAGGHGHDVTGIGNVAVILSSREIQRIAHLLYLPSICKNLLSVDS
ncbi:hypothetical protein M758_UG298500 [Ceratodon purpureus]|nr:hypothetical protein M758_UG298500 [Ceratodon purpureus]